MSCGFQCLIEDTCEHQECDKCRYANCNNCEWSDTCSSSHKGSVKVDT